VPASGFYSQTLEYHRPCDSRVLSTPQVLPGDVLVMGSDGLWDNVADDELLDLVLSVRLLCTSDKTLDRTSQSAVVFALWYAVEQRC